MKTALIVDDDEMNRIVLESFLKKLNFQTTSLPDGLSVIEVLKQNFYDVIFLDISMPVLNGDELCKQIRHTIPKEKLGVIFAYTAHTLKEDEQRLMSSGFDDLLIKPIDMRLLKEKLTSLKLL